MLPRKAAFFMAKTDSNRIPFLMASYQSALQLKMYEGELVWSRYGVMLTIHTIFLSLAGILLKTESGIDAHMLGILIPISFIGYVFCYFWLNVTARGFITNNFWLYEAKELEFKIHTVDIDMLNNNGAILKDEHKVELVYGTKDKDRHTIYRNEGLRRFNTEESAYFIIYIFAVIYLILFYIGLFSLKLPF